MRIPVIAVLVLALSSLAAAQQPAQTAGETGAPWSYVGPNGPKYWGKLDPAYQTCSKGREQSPINIHDARLNKALKPIEFNYIGGPVTVDNTGHAIVVHVLPGSYITIGGVRYNLVSLSFHHPSEHQVDGQLYDMEVDYLHRSASGKKVILAVLLTERNDFPNATLSTIWNHLPTTAGASEKISNMVNPGGLIPRNRGYWTYMGSLPAPPCTEGVRWFVFENPVNISQHQLITFSNIFRLNTRPVQKLRGRRIEANQ